MSSAYKFTLQGDDKTKAAFTSINNNLRNTKNNFSKFNRDVANSSTFAKNGVQQLGFQVQDFAVQVGNGTSAITAFGQQGSQLLGIFGPTGAVAGALVAVTAALTTAFAPSLMESKNAVDELSKTMERLRSITTDSGDGVLAFSKTMKELSSVGAAALGAEIEASLIRAQQAAGLAATALTEKLSDLDASFGFSNIETYVDALNNTSKSTNVNIQAQDGFIQVSRELGEQLGKTGEQARALGQDIIESLADLQVAPTADKFKSLEVQLSDLAKGNENVSDKTKLLISDLRLFFAEARSSAESVKFLQERLDTLNTSGADNLITSFETVRDLNTDLAQDIAISQLRLEGNTAEAERLAFAFKNGVSNFEQLPETAQTLYTAFTNVNTALSQTQELMRQQQQGASALESFNRLFDSNSLEAQNQARIDAINELVLSEEEIQKAGYDSLLELQKDYIDKSNELYNDQKAQRDEKNFQLFEKEVDRAQREKNLKEEETERNRKIARDDFFANLQIAGQKNKKLAKIAKAGAIVNATIKTYEAVNNALAAPYLPPIPQIFAGAALAAGLANVAAIRSTPIDGAREKGGPVGMGKTYLVGEKGPELFTPGATGQITSNSNLQQAIGGNSATPINYTTNISGVGLTADELERVLEKDKKRFYRYINRGVGVPA